MTKENCKSRLQLKRELQLFLAYVQDNSEMCYYKEYINTRSFSAREWHAWLKEYASDMEVTRLWDKICDILETRLNIG